MTLKSAEIKRGAASFRSTNWSLISEAGRIDSPEARQALAQLCQAYWYPLYAYVRRHGSSPEDAEDLTQGFFQRLLEKNYVSIADRNRGRFRSFLLSLLEHYLSKEKRRKRAAKRGGGPFEILLKEQGAEERYRAEAMHNLSPELLYERRWALALIDLTLETLRQEMTDGGKGDLFHELEDHLEGEGTDQSYTEIGQRLNMSEGAVKTAAHRLRRRYAEILRDEVAKTVSNPAEVDLEIRHLISVIKAI